MTRGTKKGARQPLVPPERARGIVSALGRWYARHRRDLPWRRTNDPYAIWVSEAMLQQTQVATVESYYERWMKRFPTVLALADSAEADVLHAWQGLGYYSRAKNLRRGAQTVVRDHGGRLPRSAEALRELPGIGPYSAGAIASIAYGERTPLVDGNVVRVLCRVFGLRGDPTRAPLKRRLWDVAAALVPASAPGDFNQALMELGATVCAPRSPACDRCPLSGSCGAHRDRLAETLPELPKRRATIAVARAAAVVYRGDKVLVVRVPDGARRWAGFWKFPNVDIGTRETPEAAARRAVHETVGIRATRAAELLTVRHSVTHHRITLDVFRFDVASRTIGARGNAAWHTPAELDDLPLPAPDRRIARHLSARQ
jgi:A/G-specific adenine glycosylase